MGWGPDIALHHLPAADRCRRRSFERQKYSSIQYIASKARLGKRLGLIGSMAGGHQLALEARGDVWRQPVRRLAAALGRPGGGCTLQAMTITLRDEA
jgi:hypothetical protein